MIKNSTFENLNLNPMKQLKFLFSLVILSLTYQSKAQFTDQINSNRPGESMGAFSVGKNIYQAEGGLYGVNDSHDVINYTANGFGLDIAGRGGFFFEQLEFILEAKFQMDQYSTPTTKMNRAGLRRTLFGAKYLFYDPFKKGPAKPNLYSWKANNKFKWRQFIPALSGYVGVNYVMENDFSIPNEAVVSPKAMIIAQNHFASGLVLVTNIFADKISSDASNFGYVVTLTKGLNDKWSAFIENKGIKGDYYSDGIFTLGATHLLKDNIQLDASISKNIKNTPSLLYGGIGISWRFDKKYKDIEIKDGKEVKSKDGEQPKGKKRLDEIPSTPKVEKPN